MAGNVSSVYDVKKRTQNETMKYRLVLLKNENVIIKEITGNKVWWLSIVGWLWINTNFLLIGMRFEKGRDFYIADAMKDTL